MKWTIDELTKRGKKVYVIDMSDKPDTGTLNNVSDLPAGVDCAVLGVTKKNPADGKILMNLSLETLIFHQE